MRNRRLRAEQLSRKARRVTKKSSRSCSMGRRRRSGALTAGRAQLEVLEVLALLYRRTYEGRRRLVAVCRVTVPANYTATLVGLRGPALMRASVRKPWRAMVDVIAHRADVRGGGHLWHGPLVGLVEDGHQCDREAPRPKRGRSADNRGL
jgi:hypothetical protein